MKLKPKKPVRKIIGILAILCILWVTGGSYGFAKKLATLPEVLKAESIRVKHDRIFVTQVANVFIYSLKDYKLIKKFGKAGEGPREFKLNPMIGEVLRVEIAPEFILVNSIGKISIFTLDGEFKDEKKTSNARWLHPLGKNFVGSAVIGDQKKLYRTMNIYGPDAKMIKEVYREEHLVQPGKITFDRSDDRLKVSHDKILITKNQGFVLHIYDKDGKLEHTIQREYKEREFTQNDKKALFDFLKREFSQVYTIMKDMVVVPAYFPPIRNFYVGNNYFYVSTFIEKDGKVQFFKFDQKGKLIKEVFLPVFKKSPVLDFPLDFYKGKLYQVVENEETEDWELHVTGIPGK